MIRNCTNCGKEFAAKEDFTACSLGCSKCLSDKKHGVTRISGRENLSELEILGFIESDVIIGYLKAVKGIAKSGYVNNI